MSFLTSSSVLALCELGPTDFGAYFVAKKLSTSLLVSCLDLLYLELVFVLTLAAVSSKAVLGDAQAGLFLVVHRRNCLDKLVVCVEYRVHKRRLT